MQPKQKEFSLTNCNAMTIKVYWCKIQHKEFHLGLEFYFNLISSSLPSLPSLPLNDNKYRLDSVSISSWKNYRAHITNIIASSTPTSSASVKLLGTNFCLHNMDINISCPIDKDTLVLLLI